MRVLCDLAVILHISKSGKNNTVSLCRTTALHDRISSCVGVSASSESLNGNPFVFS